MLHYTNVSKNNALLHFIEKGRHFLFSFIYFVYLPVNNLYGHYYLPTRIFQFQEKLLKGNVNIF